MSSVDKIKWAMSLREPQYEALQYFDAISSKIEYRTRTKAEAEKKPTAEELLTEIRDLLSEKK